LSESTTSTFPYDPTRFLVAVSRDHRGDLRVGIGYGGPGDGMWFTPNEASALADRLRDAAVGRLPDPINTTEEIISASKANTTASNTAASMNTEPLIAIATAHRPDGSVLVGIDSDEIPIVNVWLDPDVALTLGRRLIATAAPLVQEELRRVWLADGTSVLVDADDPNDDDEIRAALKEPPRAELEEA
jgi:hypothetical protein